MAGKPGQMSQKPARLPEKFDPVFPANLDGRTVAARELKGRLDELMADLGGPDALTYQRRTLCKRVIFIEARLEAMDVAFALGLGSDTGRYAVLNNALVGVLKALGLRRQPKHLTLEQYLRTEVAT